MVSHRWSVGLIEAVVSLVQLRYIRCFWYFFNILLKDNLIWFKMDYETVIEIWLERDRWILTALLKIYLLLVWNPHLSRMNLFCHLLMWLEFQPQSLRWLFFSFFKYLMFVGVFCFAFPLWLNLCYRMFLSWVSELVWECAEWFMTLGAWLVWEICFLNLHISYRK